MQRRSAGSVGGPRAKAPRTRDRRRSPDPCSLLRQENEAATPSATKPRVVVHPLRVEMGYRALIGVLGAGERTDRDDAHASIRSTSDAEAGRLASRDVVGDAEPPEHVGE